MPADFSIHADLTTPEVRLEVTGELDIATVSQLEQAFQRTHAAHGTPILVDLTAVRFVDSTGLRTLLHIRDASQLGGVRFALSPAAERLLEITGLTDQLPRWTGEQDATNS